MTYSDLALAALATTAVPGLDAVGVRRVVGPEDDGLDQADVFEQTGQQWRIRAPRVAGAGARLEAEVTLLDALTGPHELDLGLPRPVAFLPLDEGGRAVVTKTLPGTYLQLDEVEAQSGLARDLGRTLARIHRVGRAAVETTGIPLWSATESRDRLRASLTRARTGKAVPPALVQRWTNQLDDDALWRFETVLIHSDLGDDRVMVQDGRVTGVTGWSQAAVDDPARDLAWLLAALGDEAFDAMLDGYDSVRKHEDESLVQRAQLVGELAIVEWLLHGLDSGDDVVVQDAEAMLEDLDVDLAQQAKDEAEASFEDYQQPR